jgi:predicted Rossmann fold nucleotide-binding protein DprA/Smf involved in DNA uptake
MPIASTEPIPTPPTSNTSAIAEVATLLAAPEDAKTPEEPINSTITILNNLKDSERLHVDSIIESSGLNAQTVLRLLLELELEGRVTQHPGKLFSLA